MRFVSMTLDPILDVVQLEAEMTAESVVRDRVVVTSSRASIDERLRDSENLGDLLDVEVARREEELELLRLSRLIVSCHVATSSKGK